MIGLCTLTPTNPSKSLYDYPIKKQVQCLLIQNMTLRLKEMLNQSYDCKAASVTALQFASWQSPQATWLAPGCVDTDEMLTHNGGVNRGQTQQRTDHSALIIHDNDYAYIHIFVFLASSTDLITKMFNFIFIISSTTPTWTLCENVTFLFCTKKYIGR